jgi:5'-methylthioadenosine phosphorylase
VPDVEIAVIGGSGFYRFDALADVAEIRVNTPFGDPSDAVTVGSLNGRRIAFLSRHGRHHRLAPSDIPVRANIYALKSLGVRQLISVSAVGSLVEHFAPGDLAVPDQIVDRTSGKRPASFFGSGMVVHIPFADPYCPRLRTALAAAARASSTATVHSGGTYCCMEGPQFSTRAESNLYRLWGLDIIGMTALPEAKLAREAEICYAGLALVTDYDCWRQDDTESVSANLVTEVMARNIGHARAAVSALTETVGDARGCPCQDALAHAVITPADEIPWAVRERLRVLVGRYFVQAAAARTVSTPPL